MDTKSLRGCAPLKYKNQQNTYYIPIHLHICVSRAAKSFMQYFFGDSWRGRSNSTHYVHSAVEKFCIEIVHSYAYHQGNAVIVFNLDVKWLAFVFLIFPLATEPPSSAPLSNSFLLGVLSHRTKLIKWFRVDAGDAFGDSVEMGCIRALRKTKRAILTELKLNIFYCTKPQK